MSFWLLIDKPSTDKNGMQNEKNMYKKRPDKTNNKSKVQICKLGYYCLRGILYWLGSALELLSTYCLRADVIGKIPAHCHTLFIDVSYYNR